MKNHVLLKVQRIPRWALSSTSHSYSLTSFRRDHHLERCWLVECRMIWVTIQRSSERSLTHFITADTAWHRWTCAMTSLEGFVRNAPVFAPCCCLAAGPNIARTLWAFRAEYSDWLWRSDWLNEAARVIGSPESSIVLNQDYYCENTRLAQH